MTRDKISINKLTSSSRIGYDRWKNINPEPISLSIDCYTKLQSKLENSINYSTLTKSLTSLCQSNPHSSLTSLAQSITSQTFSFNGVEGLDLTISKLKGLLNGKLTLNYRVNDDGKIFSEYTINDIDIYTIIGIHPWERQFKQKVIIDLSVSNEYNNLNHLIDSIINFIQQSSYLTIENLVLDAVKYAVVNLKVPKVTLKAHKPDALTFANSASVEITRQSSDYDIVVSNQNSNISIIALGSNLGNKFNNILKSLSLIEGNNVGKILDTSFLYETKPMYVLNQPSFLNGVCKLSTSLTPVELLKGLKDIEETLGRDLNNGVVKGPRPIDLDIVFYNNDNVNDEINNLIIPHKGLHERSFVLAPLSDIIPYYKHPSQSLNISQMLERLNDDSIKRVVPLINNDISSISIRDKRFIMGIVNCTPDSFSDGGKNFDLNFALNNVKNMVNEGVDIVDIGGMSTRPNAPNVEIDEELSRIIPLIKNIKELFPELIISVDTFRASVAKAAVEAGANIINDVTGGDGDKDMLDLVAKLGVPYILMHMRGNPNTMMKETYYENGVIEGVKEELEKRFKFALEKGIRRWNIIIDPGLGFAKDLQGNIDILKNLHKGIFGGRFNSVYNEHNGQLDDSININLNSLPLLIGHSRKAFIGTLTNEIIPKDRTIGTTATTMAALNGGADIVRVHDIKPNKDVINIAHKL